MEKTIKLLKNRIEQNRIKRLLFCCYKGNCERNKKVTRDNHRIASVEDVLITIRIEQNRIASQTL